ncbi:MAG TPA: ATP-dependent Clp protease ATP-binding subunit [Chloroflexi bacterium]|nr:ATP-dependent Clp protease ATP-binding subunit [Chloroflexota bacterium]
MSKRGLLSPKIPSGELTQALNRAAGHMQKFNKRVLTAEILLYTYLKLPDTAAHRILRQLADQRRFNWASFEQQATRAAQERLTRDMDFDFKTDSGQKISLGDDILYLIDEGLVLAQARDETRCGTEHTLVFMPNARVSVSRLLNSFGVTSSAVSDLLTDPALSSYAAARDHVALAKNGRMAPVHFRDDLLQNLLGLLSMAHNRHVILVGATGVGKRSLAYALAQLIANGSGPVGLTRLIEMNEQALLDNALSTARAGLRLAQGGILFAPNIHRFFGGFRAEFPENACAELQKAFFDDQVVILGTATPGRFNDRLQANSTIAQHSNIFEIPPAGVDETIPILGALEAKFESDYHLSIQADALNEVARLAGRYLNEDPLPGSAVHLLHRACVQVNLNKQTANEQKPMLTVETVRQATSQLTGIPVSNMGADERKRYAQMEEHLHKRIIGQEEAVETISRAVKTARVGLKDPKRPIGSFLFLGPTGVGKSELAKALAEFMFGTEDALVTFDMSEYMDESSVNRLIGSPPGYVGSKAGGQLTNAVMARPYSVVLFDEVEKAAVKIFDLLLQIMDEGRLTSGKGEIVKFSECIVLMTSNIGGRDLAKIAQLGEAFVHSKVEETLSAHFRPEFLNRLDDIIYFHSLDNDHLRRILDLMLKKEFKLLAQQNLTLRLGDDAKTWLLSKNEHPEWGARPLRRIIQEYIRAPLADFLLAEDPQAGVSIKMVVEGDELKFIQASGE